MRDSTLGSRFVLLLAMLAFANCGNVSRANEATIKSQGKTARTAGAPAPSAPEPTVPPSVRELAAWVRDLGDDGYVVRDKAQSNLAAAGEAALEHVARAVGSAEPEVRQRAVDILRRHAIAEREPLATKARAALDELSRSKDSNAARAAASAIAMNDRTRQQQQDELAIRDRMVRGRVVFGGARPLVIARAKAIAIAPGATSLQISVVNGKRSIVAQADGQKVEISDGGEDGIKMSITKKVDGKDKKESFTAKDADELKSKHAEAHKVYEKYTKPAAKPARKAILDPVEVWKSVLPKEALPPKGVIPKAVPPKLPPVEHTDVPRSAPTPRK
jgi:hypothetical protein